MKWATKAWEEGYLESKADHTNLVDFNSTLESLHNKLKTQVNATTTQQDSSTAEGTPRGGPRQDQPPRTVCLLTNMRLLEHQVMLLPINAKSGSDPREKKEGN